MCQRDYFHAKSTPDELKRFIGEMTASFLGSEYDRVECIYTHYKSVASQIVKTRILLPISIEDMHSVEKPASRITPYIYEPDRDLYFRDGQLPLYDQCLRLSRLVCKAVHRNRVPVFLAMQTASDNAGKLLDELRLEYNKLRQQGITNELLDIVGGSIR